MASWGLLLVGVLLASAALARWIGEIVGGRHTRGAFRELAPTPIAETPSGRDVQVVGTLRIVGDAPRAPIRDREVVYVRLVAEGGRSVHAAAPRAFLETTHSWADVEIEDRTGRVRIDPSDAAVEIDPDRHPPREHVTAFIGTQSPSITEHIASRGLESGRDEHGEPWKHLFLAEHVIEAGARVAILGSIATGEGPYRGAPILRARRIRLLG